ncbi:hypothetical protein E4T52_16938 [Aureobasidium sp. EXF-3400]|nr:hypothetical protein E4T51_16185 [Aureobasidium sp. EXF-12344]KAI4767953.1 hypothetical protein E4T52_16938 [Aureobasidium sp. EXF-3400]
MSATPPEVSRPSRKLKVRTGCITCKIRKVKCDEEKPSCKRCTDARRKCDGYAIQPERKSVKSAAPSDRAVVHSTQNRPSPPTTSIPHRAVRRLAPAKLIVDAAFLSPAVSGEDSPWIEYFSVRTGPALSNVLVHTFWSFTLPQLSASEPAIRHALIALSAAHVRFETDAANNHSVHNAIDPNFILRHYKESIKQLKLYLSRDPRSLDYALLCCLLFISMECIYGNRILVVGHLQNGLNMLKSSLVQDGEKETSSNAVAKSIRQEVRPLFHRLDAQKTLMGFSGSSLFNKTDELFILSVPRSFDSLEHAKRSLDLLVASSLGFIRTIHEVRHAENGSISLSGRTLQIHLLSKSSIWKNSMANFVKSCNIFTEEDNRFEKSLRLQHTATFIWLARCTELEESGFDAYLPEFASIVKWSRALIAPTPESQEPCLHTKLAALSVTNVPRFSLNMGYIPPLYLVAIKCRDPITRREAISILEETNGREGLWDARLHAKVARRWMEVEEASVLIYQGAKTVYMEPGPMMRIIADGEVRVPQKPKECFRVRDMEVRNITEGIKGSCTITIRTYPNGPLEEKAEWTEILHF